MTEIFDDLEGMRAEFNDALSGTETPDALQQVKVLFLGKKGKLTSWLKNLGSLPPEERPRAGEAVNSLRDDFESRLADRRAFLEERQSSEVERRSGLDVTLPARGRTWGGIHPVAQLMHDVVEILAGLGFSVALGPEIEDDFHNFEALNIPASHPARDMQDTFYFPDGHLLRTHTSPVQVRTMLRAVREGSGPPIYVVCPGRAYRQDTADATHLPVFHQIEMLVIDRGITMGDLSGTIETFTKAYFGQELTSRLRPSYFPFTEPSAEVDISQPDGSWLEVGGCGMVHPNVLRAGGLDPEEWSGFAFGFGIERLTMIRHHVTDIRDFITNDMRFLEQF